MEITTDMAIVAYASIRREGGDVAEVGKGSGDIAEVGKGRGKADGSDEGAESE